MQLVSIQAPLAPSGPLFNQVRDLVVHRVRGLFLQEIAEQSNANPETIKAFYLALKSRYLTFPVMQKQGKIDCNADQSSFFNALVENVHTLLLQAPQLPASLPVIKRIEAVTGEKEIIRLFIRILAVEPVSDAIEQLRSRNLLNEEPVQDLLRAKTSRRIEEEEEEADENEELAKAKISKQTFRSHSPTKKGGKPGDVQDIDIIVSEMGKLHVIWMRDEDVK